MLRLAERLGPLAYIVHVPRTRDPKDVAEAQAKLAELEAYVKRDRLLSHVEQPELLLIDGRFLPAAEREYREQNLRMLRNGSFKVVHFSGSQTSEYVRELIRVAYQTRVLVHNVADPDSILARYIALHEAPHRFLV